MKIPTSAYASSESITYIKFLPSASNSFSSSDKSLKFGFCCTILTPMVELPTGPLMLPTSIGPATKSFVSIKDKFPSSSNIGLYTKDVNSFSANSAGIGVPSLEV